MARESLEELIRKIPSRTSPWANDAGSGEFKPHCDIPAGYVWPDVETLDISDSQAGVLLIHSPGAMGKSAAAHAIAAKTNAPLIDLSTIRVGSGSLRGTLAGNLSDESYVQLVQALRRGEASLVLDGLDEAQLLAGRENFVAFIGDLGDMMADSASNLQIIALGRRESIETAYLTLLDTKCVVDLYMLTPFTETQAHQFIDNTLDARPDYDTHRQQRQPFCDSRDSALKQIARSLVSGDQSEPSWEETSDFLGYAPVLQVLAEELAETNFSRTATALPSVRGDLLGQIVMGIVQRESTKVQQRLGRALALPSSVSNIIYSPEEQMSRLMAIHLDRQLQLPQPAMLPADKREQYETHLEEFSHDHPFIRDSRITNVVFADYVFAHLLTTATLEAQGWNRDELVNSHTPGPFFASFVHSLAKAQLQTEDLTNLLIASNVVAASGRSRVDYVHRKDGSARLRLRDVTDNGEESRPELIYEIESPTGILELQTPLADTRIIAENIRLYSEGPILEIGPDVTLIARDIYLDGTRLIVTSSIEVITPTHFRFNSSLISVTSSLSCNHTMKVVAYGQLPLAIDAPNPPHQFRPFLLPSLDLVRHGGIRSQEILQGLRKILLAFNTGEGQQLSAYWERLERVIIGPSDVLEAVLKGLQSLNIVVRSGDNYFLETDELQRYGIHWNMLKNAGWEQGCFKLYRDLCATQSIRELRAQ